MSELRGRGPHFSKREMPIAVPSSPARSPTALTKALSAGTASFSHSHTGRSQMLYSLLHTLGNSAMSAPSLCLPATLRPFVGDFPQDGAGGEVNGKFAENSLVAGRGLLSLPIRAVLAGQFSGMCALPPPGENRCFPILPCPLGRHKAGR